MTEVQDMSCGFVYAWYYHARDYREQWVLAWERGEALDHFMAYCAGGPL